MPRRLIQVFEHESLYYSEEGPFKESDYNALLTLNDRNDKQYFTPGRKHIKFSQFVGVIQVGNLTIEILPKVDRVHKGISGQNDEKLKSKWRSALIHMLRECKKLQVSHLTQADLHTHHHTLLDLYLLQFVTEVSKLIHLGLIKKYRGQEGNVTALKGRLVFQKQISQNLVHSERFYTKHQTYDHNHLLHQILFRALQAIDSTSNHPQIRDKVSRILLDFPETTEVIITEEHFQRLSLDRKSNPYAEALTLAKMIILNLSPDIQAGDSKVLSILFDMNQLFEEYILVQLKKAQTIERGYVVEGQISRNFWGNKHIRTDILLSYHGKQYVIDTKWKLITDESPADDDLKQIFVYNQYYNADLGVLLYPSIGQAQKKAGHYHISDRSLRWVQQGDLHACKLGYLELFERNPFGKEQLKGADMIAQDVLALLD